MKARADTTRQSSKRKLGIKRGKEKRDENDVAG